MDLSILDKELSRHNAKITQIRVRKLPNGTFRVRVRAKAGTRKLLVEAYGTTSLFARAFAFDKLFAALPDLPEE